MKKYCDNRNCRWCNRRRREEAEQNRLTVIDAVIGFISLLGLLLVGLVVVTKLYAIFKAYVG